MRKKLKDCSILVVDDVKTNIDILVETLGDSYDIRVATSGIQALNAIEIETPDLILLDIMMPEMDGYEVCRRIKSSEKNSSIRIVFLTAVGEDANEALGFQLGAVDYIRKPYNPLVVKARVKTQLQLMIAQREIENQNEILEEMVKERTKELETTQNITIHSLAALAESRDKETGDHIFRTQTYVRELAIELQKTEKYKDIITKEMVENLYKSAPLHDVGKISIPDSILKKPGKLTDEEYTFMKTHTTNGKNAFAEAELVLGNNSFLKTASEIAYSHHEKWDGSGYPLGLKGEEIPLSGRIMAIADVYDALSSKRVYKDAISHEKVIEIMVEGSGSHFDPYIIENAFLKIKDKFKEISEKSFLNNF